MNDSSVIRVPVEDEIKESYMNYAMSVIVSRALPDVRDGLKPVHRRILHSMNEIGLHHNRPFRKSVHVIGDVLARSHPHGDQSVYDALVRMAQTFSLRIPLIDSQGNFGSIDGDPPAAMRYTEARMAAVADAMLRDLKKDTVDFIPNYDGSRTEPTVLPAAFPFLLVNGSSGIAVGMATNMPPHNLVEVCNGIQALLKDPSLDSLALLEYVKGPDFPTNGIIYGYKGLRDAALTGKGRIIVRSRYHLEKLPRDREAIIITEIPYMVNKANLIVKIAELVRDKKLDGISDLRDESDRKGIRIVIELKNNAAPLVVLNILYKHTALQTAFNVNNLALDHGSPRLFKLKDMLAAFIAHRKEVIVRRTNFDLRKAQEREHILQGLQIALANIDEVIESIKSSANSEEASLKLVERFVLSERQAQAILEMRLQRLTNLETQKIISELKEVQAMIADFEDILANEQRVYDIIGQDTAEISNKYGDERRTEINPQEIDASVDIGDYIKEEDMLILISHQGFIKRIPTDAYKEQGRGGKGSKSTQLRDEDFIEHIFIANTHTYILFVSNKGKAYKLKAYELPEGSRSSKGRHLRTVFQLGEGEEITTSVVLNEFREDSFLFMATKNAVVKRVSTYEFRNTRQSGIKAINIDEGDYLIAAILTTGNDDIGLFTALGKGLRFHEEKVRSMGRAAHGVCGIRLAKNDQLVAVCRRESDEQILLITANGYGKRMVFEQFTPHARATQGQRSYNISQKTGNIIGAVSVRDAQSVIAITNQGKTIKIAANTVASQGRSTTGVRILMPTAPEYVVGITWMEDIIAASEDQEDQDE